MSTRRLPGVLCEDCRAEPAISFSWFLDPDRPYARSSGVWRSTGLCTAQRERYYVSFSCHLGDGFLDSPAAQRIWERHLIEKRWFDPKDFAAAVERFQAAGGVLPAELRLRPRRRQNP